MESRARWFELALRAIAELSIIVVGVLIALSADTWIDAARERRAEIEYLTALHDDLIDTSESLAVSDRNRDRLFYSLIRLIEDDLAEAPADSVSRWVYDGLFSIESFEPRLATLADLENTGQLALLPLDVRRGIAEFRQSLDEVDRIEDDFVESQQRLLDSFLVEEVPLAPILATSDSLPISTALSGDPNWSALQSDRALNAMAFKLSLGRLATGSRRRFGNRLDDLLGAVERRLRTLGAGAG